MTSDEIRSVQRKLSAPVNDRDAQALTEHVEILGIYEIVLHLAIANEREAAEINSGKPGNRIVPFVGPEGVKPNRRCVKCEHEFVGLDSGCPKCGYQTAWVLK